MQVIFMDPAFYSAQKRQAETLAKALADFNNKYLIMCCGIRIQILKHCKKFTKGVPSSFSLFWIRIGEFDILVTKFIILVGIVIILGGEGVVT